MKIVDFVEFFVGENLKASRIVPYAPATPNSRPQLTSFANVRRQGLERRKWARRTNPLRGRAPAIEVEGTGRASRLH